MNNCKPIFAQCCMRYYKWSRDDLKYMGDYHRVHANTTPLLYKGLEHPQILTSREDSTYFFPTHSLSASTFTGTKRNEDKFLTYFVCRILLKNNIFNKLNNRCGYP